MAEKIRLRPDLPDDGLEEWFLNHLPQSPVCFNQLLEVIVRFAEKDQPDRAEACADLLEDALKKNQAEEELLLLLERRAGWQSDLKAYAETCGKTLTGFFQGQNLKQIYLASCGMQNETHPQEALRRLRVLCALQPGRCCYEKTWGPGIIHGIDEFDRKLVIDFEGKPAHRLALSYAAESVQPLDDDHFLALKLKDPEKFHQWVRDNPAETVKAVLQQFGEMNLPRLRALMAGLVVPEKEWSSFWSLAREKLSADPLVQMPAGRNEPIRILSARKEFDDRWRDNFLALRDVDRILAEVESLFGCCPPQSLAGDLKAAVEDRLKFVVRGIGTVQTSSRREHHAVIIQALLFAAVANIGSGLLFDISIYGRPEILLTALNSIPARMIRPFLTYLEKNSLPITDTLLQIMPQLLSSALNEVINHYRPGGKDEQLCEKMRVIFQEGVISVEMLLWMGCNLQFVGEKNVCRPEDFAKTALAILRQALAAGKKKDAGQLLRQIFTDKDLLKEMLQPMSAERRLDFSRRLNSLAGLSAIDKIDMAAKVISLFPDLASAFGAPVVVTAQPKLTSYRTYRERQAQLAKIINEEIPRNSKEIGAARSYGDLRENYEYKAAREMQGLLMRRKVDSEQMLSEVSSADFAGFPHDVAGQGTSVELKMPDGGKQVYHILGEWDSDEKLGIISCRSKLAEALRGHHAGDSVEIPGENHSVSCVIETIRELPPEIKDWLNGE
ncbi:MAG: GreA/GreB family elongation factor [Kiritimatiellia bacterium]|nr:GreA/GreB family elongation factor [Kiritimatiellia bacterium]